MPYSSQTDLENALGVNTVKAIFDDDGDGIADAAPVAACLESADAEVDSALAGQYPDGTPTFNSVPKAIKFAAIDFACAYAARRRPDVVRAMGEVSWETFRKVAEDKIEKFASSQKRLPVSAGTPANTKSSFRVGGVDQPTDLPSRVFDDMGDF